MTSKVLDVLEAAGGPLTAVTIAKRLDAPVTQVMGMRLRRCGAADASSAAPATTGRGHRRCVENGPTRGRTTELRCESEEEVTSPEQAPTTTTRVDGNHATWSVLDRVVYVREVRLADGTRKVFDPTLELGMAISEMPRRLWDEVRATHERVARDLSRMRP